MEEKNVIRSTKDWENSRKSDVKEDKGRHELSLFGRKLGVIYGVVEMLSFDSQTIMMDTDLGVLKLEGQNLLVTGVDLKEGKVTLEGMVSALSYSQRGHKRDRESIWKRLLS